jgi:hypothetical protein
MMRRRPFDPRQPPVHPLAPLLIAILAAGVLWPLSHFFGVGTRLFEYALAAGLVFGSSIIFTLVVAGLIWGAIKLFRSRK